MEFFRGYFKQLEYYFFLVLSPFILQGCNRAESVSTGEIPSVREKKEESVEMVTEEKTWVTSYELTEEVLLKWEWIKEAETENYYIEEQQNEEEGTYPQIVLKEGREIFCGTEHLNNLLSGWYSWKNVDYSILYADKYYISILYFNKETKELEGSFIINIQCPVVENFVNEQDYLLYVQDDNDYRHGPWPSNGIRVDLDEILEEIEKGNCYLDERAYILWKKNPEELIESIRKQFFEIKNGGYEEAYYARYFNYWEECKKVYRMYLREGRVGFYIHPINYWEDEERTEENDFRIEVEYDWKRNAPLYHMSYEIYGQINENFEYGILYYPQIKGLNETVMGQLNEAMKNDLKKNLEYMNQEEWNEKMKPYGYEEYWEKMPRVGNPMVTYQTERYLCICQELVTSEDEALRFAEEWKRYHVYDLETGKSLRLEDIISLDRDFIRWLKEEKKIEARCEWSDGMRDFDVMTEYMKEDLEDYPEELLLSILEDAEFWIKEDSLYLRIPYYDQHFEIVQYTGGGSGSLYYIAYAEVRIAVEELKEFLKVESW